MRTCGWLLSLASDPIAMAEFREAMGTCGQFRFNFGHDVSFKVSVDYDTYWLYSACHVILKAKH